MFPSPYLMFTIQLVVHICWKKYLLELQEAISREACVSMQSWGKLWVSQNHSSLFDVSQNHSSLFDVPRKLQNGLMRRANNFRTLFRPYTSLMLTCVNSHLLTYVPLPLTTSRHRQCLISHSFHYCIPAWCTLHCDYVSHPHWASTSILDIFTTSSLMLYACRSLSSQILFRNDPKLHPTSQIAPVNVLMPIFDSI